VPQLTASTFSRWTLDQTGALGSSGFSQVPTISKRRKDGVRLERITLHECRHTYASFLMAAGYTLKELMEFMGHADRAMVQRYVKLLPQPEESNPADRLNRYRAGGAAET
jgi:integrase